MHYSLDCHWDMEMANTSQHPNPAWLVTVFTHLALYITSVAGAEYRVQTLKQWSMTKGVTSGKVKTPLTT